MRGTAHRVVGSVLDTSLSFAEIIYKSKKGLAVNIYRRVRRLRSVQGCRNRARIKGPAGIQSRGS
jgi:hypothetical protein